MKILGIDPGTNILGFGIIESKGNAITAIDYGIIRLDKLETYDKLSKIYSEVSNLIEKHAIEEVAIEAPFFGDNAQSMLKLGRAQGVAIAAAAILEKPVTEYAPKKVKLAVTGKGFSTKEQVAQMVMSLLNIKVKPQTLDATDALGVAITHALQGSNEQLNIPKGNKTKPGKKSDWASFLKNNPNRIIK